MKPTVFVVIAFRVSFLIGKTDAAVTFTGQPTTAIVDNNARSASVVATVLGVADNGVIAHTITSVDNSGITYFGIDSTTGIIRVTAAGQTALSSAAASDTFTITVSAQDTDSTPITHVITVSVNLPPVIVGSPFTFNAYDGDASGTVVGSIVVTDPDSDSMNYVLTGSGNGDFTIANKAILADMTLSKGYMEVYTLEAEVNDGRLTSTAAVTINILTNLPPAIVGSPFTFNVNDGSFAGTVVGSIVVTDPNSDPMNYLLTGTGNADFDFSNKEITALTNLATTVYTLEAEVNDGRLTFTATVTINVIANQPPAIVGSPFTFNVDDGSTSGTAVGSIVVTDPNFDFLSYALTGTGNADFDFSNKEITALTNLATTVYTLEAEVNDGRLTSTATVTINVIANQPPAIVGSPFTFNVNDGSTSGTAVGSIVVTDPNFDFLSYALTGTGNADFAIANKAITAATTLSTAVYTLEAEVDDGRLTSTATITINVNAVSSNNDPVFSSTTYSFTATNGTVPGIDVGTVTITDADSDTWTFAIVSGNINTDFAITNTGNLKIGTIATANALAKETTSSYDLRVTINDGTVTVTATVTITFSRASTLVPMLLMMMVCWLFYYV